MADVWTGHEHREERLRRFEARINGDSCDPHEVIVGDPEAGQAEEILQLSYDKKDLWQEMLKCGMDAVLRKCGVHTSPVDMRAAVEFTLFKLGPATHHKPGWEKEMMRYYLETAQNAYAWKTYPPRRFLGFTYGLDVPKRTPRWAWVRPVGVEVSELTLTIEGRCAVISD